MVNNSSTWLSCSTLDRLAAPSRSLDYAAGYLENLSVGSVVSQKLKFMRVFHPFRILSTSLAKKPKGGNFEVKPSCLCDNHSPGAVQRWPLPLPQSDELKSACHTHLIAASEYQTAGVEGTG